MSHLLNYYIRQRKSMRPIHVYGLRWAIVPCVLASTWSPRMRSKNACVSTQPIGNALTNSLSYSSLSATIDVCVATTHHLFCFSSKSDNKLNNTFTPPMSIVCLKYLLCALRMDNFYANGLILLKKYEELMRELDYPEIIDSFVKNV